MSMISWPFDSTVTEDTEGNPIYSRTYSSDVLATILRKYFRNGVFTSAEDSFRVLAGSGMALSVSAGHCLINGRHGYNESAQSIAVSSANPSLPRIDLVVLRLDLGVNVLDINVAVVAGTPATTPSAPALTRNSTVYEMALAEVYVGAGVTEITQAKITDTRLDSSRCGVVASIIGDTDTSTYYAQIAADLAEFRAGREADFDAWYNTIVAVLDEATAGHLLNIIRYQSPITLTAVLPAAGWSAGPPYSQSVSVEGLLSADVPLVDIVLSETAETALAQLDAYGLIHRAVAGDGALTAVCLESVPDVDLTLSLRVMRGITDGAPVGMVPASLIQMEDGKTAEEAVALKANATDVMRLLISRTIQSGESLANITWEQDDNGNALSLHEAELRIWIPANGATVGSNAYVAGKVNGVSSGYYGSTSDEAATLEITVFRAAFGTALTTLKLMGNKLQCVNQYRYSDGTTRAAGTRVSGSKDSISAITSIYLAVSGAGLTAFPVGTIFEIYGR